MTQNFKGDPLELQFQAAGEVAFNAVHLALDDYFENAYITADFLLMLYDAGRMPFSERVPRESFVGFIKQSIPNSQFLGSFESYLFIIKSIFGDTADVIFDIPDPGKIDLTINVAGSGLDFDWIARELVEGEFVTSEMVTSDGDQLILRGLAGIDSQAELNQLLSELIPVGLYPTIELTLFFLFQWVAEDNLGDLYTIVDDLDNEIIFYETE